MVAVQMGTYGSARFSPMMNNMNNIPSLCQDMIGTYYGISLPVVLSLAHIRLVGSIFSTLSPVSGIVPGHGPHLYKIPKILQNLWDVQHNSIRG